MKQILTRLLIFVICCIMCIHTFSISTHSVIYILLAIILAFGTMLIADRLSPTAPVQIHAGIFILCCMIPELVVFLPLFCFYLSRRPVCYTAPIGILAIILATTKFSVETLLLICVLCLCSMLYGYLTTELATLHQQMKHLTDTSETNELLAKERIRMIRKEQDNRIYTATLKERNRIAREIHDNVGHMLTRSILQVGAIQTINKEPILTNPLSDLRTTLDTAMNSIRSSVHDLHDESIDTKAAIQDMLNDITGFHTSFEYDMSNIVPKDIKYCLISIAKEAITNAVKHSNGDQLSILIREHPGFYQLTIHDNGTDIHLTDTPGIGLTNIRERVQSLSGTLQITTNSGFRLFVSIPKHTQKGDRTA